MIKIGLKLSSKAFQKNVIFNYSKKTIFRSFIAQCEIIHQFMSTSKMVNLPKLLVSSSSETSSETQWIIRTERKLSRLVEKFPGACCYQTSSRALGVFSKAIPYHESEAMETDNWLARQIHWRKFPSQSEAGTSWSPSTDMIRKALPRYFHLSYKPAFIAILRG